ncbi:MAG: GAF domain-containing protein [Candidatus Eiseniibacteriota bacterium]|nr:MAG: GAF domain-containing protein [Candidatus Eisenbacteria bacterium]
MPDVATRGPFSEEALRTFLSRTSEALLLTDPDDNILEASESVREIWGFPPEEIVGKSLRCLFSRSNPPDTAVQISKEVACGGWQGELLGLKKDGEEFPLIMTARPVVDETNEVVFKAHFIREITDKRASADLSRTLQEAYDELQTAYEVNLAISQSIDLERTLKEIVVTTKKALQASNCFLFLLDERRNELVGVATSAQDPEFDKLRVGMRETVAGVWVVKEKQPLSIKDLSKDPRACVVLKERYGQKSALFVPLIVNDTAIGTMILDDTEKERVFSAAEVRRAQSIANQAGLAIQRARLYQAVKEKVQEVTVLYEVGHALSSSLESETVLNEMMRILSDSFGYLHCAILLLNEDKTELHVKAFSGYAENVDRLSVKVGQEGITGWVAATGRPLYVPDVLKDPRYVAGLKNVRSEIALPLKIGETVLGVLNVESTEPTAFRERDVRILSSLAAQAAVAIENARLYAEVQSNAEELDAACRDLETSRQDILKANERLREMDRLKSEFLATMSHELRTPLTAIIAYSELLRDERVAGSKRLEFLEIITDQGQRLLQLIDDLLDLSKLESGKTQLTLEQGDLNQIVLSAVDTIRPTAEKRGLELVLELTPDLPCVFMDTKRIRQVCWNLLCNAVKFTDRGGRITVCCSDSGEELLVSISDTGVGIKEEDLERIFDRFAQVDSSATRSHGGAGLGLDLVRHFVLLHSGRVWVESEYGRGSIFFFTLPKEKAVLVEEPVDVWESVTPSASDVADRACTDEDASGRPSSAGNGETSDGPDSAESPEQH